MKNSFGKNIFLKNTFSWLLPLLILPIAIGVVYITKTQSTEIRSKAYSGSSNTNKCKLSAATETTLGIYAKERSFNIGTLLSECYNAKLTPIEQTKCFTILKNDFSGMTVNYQVSWRSMEPTQGNIQWDLLDRATSFARANNLKIHFFHLIWTNHGRYINPPAWVFPGRTETNCGTRTKSELEQIMKEHIQEMISRGGTTVAAWNVVNEAFNDDGTLLQDCYYKTIGPDYIDKAFRFAREESSTATLVLNEYFPGGSKFKQKVNGFFTYVKEARNRGVPIDAVGIQNHQLQKNGYQFSKDYINDIKYIFQKAKETNVEVYFTETDIYQSGKTQQEVANVYKNTVSLCLSNSNCHSFAVWGVSDKFSWARTPEHADIQDAKPVLFDESFVRKPAYYGIMTALQENQTRTCLNLPATPTIQAPTKTSTPKASPSPKIGPRCYTNKNKETCEAACGEKTGVSNKCKWLDTKNSCVEGLKPCTK